MLLYNCGCFSEKFLESLGVTPGLFSKKDMIRREEPCNTANFSKSP